jgi:dihydropteroate synthase
MGILNVTPDSFSDGGQLLKDDRLQLDKALARAEAMHAAGATIIDIGGESTRPGAAPVSVQEETDRVVPLVEAIAARLDSVISVDTSSPEVMRLSAASGAGLINDVRALARDGAIAAVADTGLPVCLMHMQGEPDTMQQAPAYQDVVNDIGDFLAARILACTDAGIARNNILLDPGFGFGKTLAHNLELLARLDELQQFGLPLLVGLSRKRMIGTITGRDTDDRVIGSVAAAVIAMMKGAWIIRVHDVVETVDAMKICKAVMTAGESK